MRICRPLAFAVLLSGALAASAFAQRAPDTELTGTVKDESGSVMQAVAVRAIAEDAESAVRETVTDARGHFVLVLPAGAHRIELRAPGFAPVDRTVTVPQRDPLDVVLALDPIAMDVTVSASDSMVASQAMSLTATTLSDEDLLDLPQNEEDLARHLMLLAGADSTGDAEADLAANFIVDGFSDGRLPRPDQIAQVIIDPSPMSADGNGQPRIEIVTRPGSGQWRRSVDLGFADESLNARTPGETRKEPRQTRQMEVELVGPLIPNVLELSVQLSTEADDRAGTSLRAVTPGASVFQGVVQPQGEREFEIGTKLRLNDRHRLDVQLTGGTEDASNASVGGFTLPERGSEDRSTEWGLRISQRMLTPNLTNNIRLQIGRSSSRVEPVGEGVAIDVAEAFEGGGGTRRSKDDDASVRLDNTLRVQRGDWSLEWGGRLQYERQQSVNEDNYNGTFEFASLHDYCWATGFAGPNCAESETIVTGALAAGVTPVYLNGRGREAVMTGVPTLFTQASGNARFDFSELAFRTHLQADRRFGDKASLRLGLGYEGTNHSRDYLRLNPTMNLQYRLTPTTLVSVGSQLRFEDFRDYERLRRNDGSTYVTELSMSSPTFPDPFAGGVVNTNDRTSSMWVLDPDYRSPYEIDPQLTVTQQVPGNTRLTLSYRASYGYRERRTRNINAPFPGTPLPDEILALPDDERRETIDRMRPLFPQVGNVTQIESTGRSVGRTVRLRVQPRGSVEAFGITLAGDVTYTYRSAEDDDDFNNPYMPEWGPSRRDHGVQSRFRIGLPDEAGFSQPWLRALARATYAGTNLNFTFRANSGRLYSIRGGGDLNGDQFSRDRPLGVVRNTEVGPATWTLDMTATKDIRLGGGSAATAVQGQGGRGGGRGRQADGPRVRLRARVHNLLNQTQPRGYGSVVTSPLFGLPTGYTNGRTMDLSMSVDF